MEITISAPPGSGKTRLARHIADVYASDLKEPRPVFLDFGDYRNAKDLYEMVYKSNIVVFDEIPNAGVLVDLQQIGRSLVRNSVTLIIYITQF